MDSKDKQLIIKTLDFWDKLNEREREYILNNTVTVNYKKGDSLSTNYENNCIGIFIVKSGGVRTYILSEDGREVTLYRLYKGDVCVLSASCILENITFDVFIEAIEDSEVFLINSMVFKNICENIYAQNYSYRITVQRFSDVMWAMQQILFMSFDKRLASFLLDESERNKNDVIALTHEEIAAYIASAREVVSRMLKYFENEGYIQLSRGKIKITNKEKLKEIL
ncbi:MAG: Crp/Fnr family transcriptional regulator [Eubacteriaceae bacterium]|nr:Crp/Fnr family transcriptional regulator [Eubacteriaceae bacterium]